MRRYLDVTSGVTGLHFLELPIPPNDGSRWVFFVNRRGLLGCTDHSIQNFTNEGIQKVVLGYDCICNGGELAEVVLAIAGVPPQHNAPDRDNYVKVHTDKILPGKQYLYTKLHDRDWLFHDLEYDFNSAGHYHFHKHSIDGSATIEPKKTVDFPVGEGEGFSYADVLKIRMLYNYISRKKQGNVKAPECKKLFKPGTNFDKYRTEKEDDQEPRKKPNKYLGLPDNEPHHSLEYDETINNNGEEPEYDEKDDKYIQKNDDDEYIQEKDENQQSIIKTRFTKLALKGKPPKIKDPLAELSDYGTDDDRRRKKKIYK
ncbi:zinc metalloproteinase nas-14-like [Ostrinia nubilalis]|uniref:zinc metalloproteinase nas-14-like n=1 Tax=Ostrinia nubilalis TaxID=29057 RepID=UPI00308223BE